MSPSQIVAILQARKGILLLVIAVTVGTAAALSWWLPPRFTATATVFVDLRLADRVTSQALPLEHASGYMATQVDIIRSPRVALNVVVALGLEKLESMRTAFENDSGGVGSIDYWIAEQLLQKLEVRPSRESSVIHISYVAPEAALAADVANGFADAYISTQIKLRTEPAQKSADIFGERTRALRTDVDQAQRRLSEYQRRQGLVVTDEKLDVELARLDQLSKQRTDAQSQADDARTRKQLAADFTARNVDIGSLPEVLANPAVMSLKAEFSRQEARLHELAARLGNNHPMHKSAIAELDGTRERIRAEMRNVVVGVGNSLLIAERRESQSTQAVEAQKAKVLEMRLARDQAALLTRDIDSAQKALESSRERQTSSRLESQIAQTNVSVLSAAVPPAKPSFPRLKLNLAIAAILGTLLGSGMALAREVSDRRVRSTDDLRILAGIPILTVLPIARVIQRRLPERLSVGAIGAVVQHDAERETGDAVVPRSIYDPSYGYPADSSATANTLGSVMIQDGKLTSDELDRIIRQQRETGTAFVDAAHELKLLTNAEIGRAMARHFDHPYVVADQTNLSNELIAIHTPFAAEVEALRGLRSELMLRWFSGDIARRTLAIVGLERSGGRSFLAANLAVLFAQVGLRTLLIDADLRAPRQHVLFGLGQTLGLSTLLADQGAPDAIHQIVELPSLAVLPAGLIPPNPQELLARSTFVDLIARFSGSFDVVLIDTPALDICADARVIAARALGALFLMQRGKTNLVAAQKLVTEMSELGALGVGLVLNEH